MPVVLSLVGIVVGLIGVVLLYVFHDPSTGDGIMLESWNPKREKVGARCGLGLVVLGATLQFVASWLQRTESHEHASASGGARRRAA